MLTSKGGLHKISWYWVLCYDCKLPLPPILLSHSNSYLFYYTFSYSHCQAHPSKGMYGSFSALDDIWQKGGTNSSCTIISWEVAWPSGSGIPLKLWMFIPPTIWKLHNKSTKNHPCPKWQLFNSMGVQKGVPLPEGCATSREVIVAIYYCSVAAVQSGPTSSMGPNRD